MTALRSLIDTRSDAFRHAERMAERLWRRCSSRGQVVAGDLGASSRSSRRRGRLLPRERVARLLDRGSSFLELSALAGQGLHDDDGKKAVLGGGAHRGHQARWRTAACWFPRRAAPSRVAPWRPLGLKKGLRAQAIALGKLPR